MNFKRFHESKNLFDENAIQNGYYGSSGSISTFTSDDRYRAFQMSIKAGTYTIKFQADEGIRFLRIATANEFYNVQEDNRAYTFVISSDAIVYVSWRNLQTTNSFTNMTVMLNTGSTPQPYEPYGWQHSLRKLGTSTDTLTTLPADVYADGNSATVGLKGQMVQSSTPSPTTPIQPQECGDLETTGEHTGQYKIPILNNSQTTNVYLGEVQSTRQIKQLIFDGTEDWKYDGTNFYLNISSMSEPVVSNSPLICSHFVNSSQGMRNGSNWAFVTLYQSATSANAWKTYLQQQYAAGTPVCVWYVLATPETAVVNEPLRKIGNYADTVSGITIPTIAGANTIDVDTTLKPSEVSVNYHGWHPVQSVHERESGAWD